eukprot:1934553-Pleurochrysis_carterae.AAC.1
MVELPYRLQILYRAAAQGRARSELVVTSTQLSHARLSWRVLTNLTLYGNLPELLTSGRAGANGNMKIQRRWAGS